LIYESLKNHVFVETNYKSLIVYLDCAEVRFKSDAEHTAREIAAQPSVEVMADRRLRQLQLKLTLNIIIENSAGLQSREQVKYVTMKLYPSSTVCD
jgi:hypothetical protein